MIFLYTLLSTVLTVLLSPVLSILSLADSRGMRQRLARRPLVDDSEHRPVVWFHCASVGEAAGLAAVVGGFVERHPGFAVLVTTMTETGLAYARKHVPQAHAFGLAPLDTPFIVRRVFGRIRPRALILLEGELWPSMLKAAAAHDCPVVLVNGRMSDRSLVRNRFVKPLFREMLRLLTAAGVQHALDGERYIAFGAEPGRVRVTGNVKFDLAAGQGGPSRAQLRRDLGFSESVPVIMAGCPRPVEEERAVLAAFVRVRERHSGAKLIWAPRHLHRVPEVEQMLRDAGLAFARLTRLRAERPHALPNRADPAYARPTQSDARDPTLADVVILDTLGELAAMYAAADMAFVGATLIPLGGHNLLEPAACGIPVQFGPHFENVRASAAALLRTGGGTVVHDGVELAREWLALLEDPGKRAQVGAAARQAVGSGVQAVDRTLDLLDRRVLAPNHRETAAPHRREALPSRVPGPRRPVDRASESPRRPGSLPFFTRLLDPEERSAAMRFARCVLLPSSHLFGILVRCRNGMYDTDLLAAERLPIPVVSVGALTVGGAGKTPVVRYLARRLREAGFRPAVLSRGYGRKAGATRLATPGASWRDVGDEPAFLASTLPDVPVVVGPSRAAAGRLAVDRCGADVLLLDDGFQHRRIGRAVDIVVHDASRRANAERMLPAGPYREPLSSLERAHVLVLTRTDQTRPAEVDPQSAPMQARPAEWDPEGMAAVAPASVPARMQARFPHLAVIETVYDPAGLRRLSGDAGDDAALTPDWLAGRAVLVFCGIANPASFVQTVSDTGARVHGDLAFRDHHPFTSSDLDRAMTRALETGTEWIVTTEKDAVRIPEHPVRDRMVVLDIALRPTAGECALDRIVSALRPPGGPAVERLPE